MVYGVSIHFICGWIIRYYDVKCKQQSVQLLSWYSIIPINICITIFTSTLFLFVPWWSEEMHAVYKLCECMFRQKVCIDTIKRKETHYWLYTETHIHMKGVHTWPLSTYGLMGTIILELSTAPRPANENIKPQV